MKQVKVFVILVLLLTWIPAFWLMLSGQFSNSALVQIIFAGFMLIPAISVILTRLITKEGFKDMKLRPNLKGNIKIYLVAWFGPTLLTILGAAIYFLVFPQQFDPSMGTIANQLMKTAGMESFTKEGIRTMLMIQIISAVFLGPLANLVFALGEELGWRGYLLPKLCKKYSLSSSIIISGIIWGIWHAPMIAMGHNYGTQYATYPWGGILAMTVFCVVVGAFFSWMMLKTDSAIPPALAHGALNSFASVSLFFLAGDAQPNVFIGPSPVGIIGGIGYVLAGAACFISCGKLKQQAIVS